MTHNNLPGNSNVSGIVTNFDAGPFSYSTGVVSYDGSQYSVKSFELTAGSGTTEAGDGVSGASGATLQLIAIFAGCQLSNINAQL